MRELLTLPGGERWSVGDVEFVYDHATPSTLGRFTLRKPPDLVAKYADLCHDFAGANVVELGIARGGSTALIALLAQPRKLVACELDPERITALDELRARDDIEDIVRPYYGIDQADRARLQEIVDDEFGTTPLDLVIDDASHLYDETLASFEVLYPRVRPGGLFIIEDWAADHTRAKFVRAASRTRRHRSGRSASAVSPPRWKTTPPDGARARCTGSDPSSWSSRSRASSSPTS